MKKLFFYGMLCCFLSVQAQQVQTKIDKSSVKIGEAIHYTLQVTALKADKVVLPILKDTFNTNIEIIGSKRDTIFKNEKAIYTQKWILAGYEEGKYNLQPLNLHINKEIKTTESFPVEILPVIIDTANQKMLPIKGIMTEQYDWWDYFQKYWLYGAVVFMVVIVAGLLLFLFFVEKKKFGRSKAVLPAYEEALKRLKELDKKQFWQKGEVAHFYTELSDILKHYFGRRYNFSVKELLSDDFLKLVKEKEVLIVTDLDKIKDFLLDADLVKFAKQNPSESKHIAYRLLVEEWIEKTKPILDDENLRDV